VFDSVRSIRVRKSSPLSLTIGPGLFTSLPVLWWSRSSSPLCQSSTRTLLICHLVVRWRPRRLAWQCPRLRFGCVCLFLNVYFGLFSFHKCPYCPVAVCRHSFIDIRCVTLGKLSVACLLLVIDKHTHLTGRAARRRGCRGSRPRRRRLEAFTTDSKIIRLISRRVAVFSTAAAWQFFDGDCDAANLKIFPG